MVEIKKIMKKFLILLTLIVFSSCDSIRNASINDVRGYSLVNNCGQIQIEGAIFGSSLLFLSASVVGSEISIEKSKIGGFISVNDNNPITDIQMVNEKGEQIDVLKLKSFSKIKVTLKVNFRNTLKRHQIITVLPNDYIMCSGLRVINDSIFVKI